MKRIRDQDEGSIFLFGIGLGIVSLLVLTTALNIASLWVTRSKLDSIADATALAATHAIDVDQIYLNGITEPLQLNESLAKAKAVAYLARLNSQSSLKNFKVLAIEVNSNSVQVTIQATADLPFGYLIPGMSPEVRASANAAIKIT